ncbi:hypothetical protein ABZV78_01235 [Micromonospora sp. NPDC004540]|uniref:hypothetical protein n=1 Tax=Micromonospora sp. NPDC004540 TaxID=3154457 RepID=UPI00339FE2AF
MNTEYAYPDDLVELRNAFGVDDAGESALGWAGVRVFEAEHGIVLPEPYRTFVAEITDGSFSGPPDYGLVGVAEIPDDWGDGRGEGAVPFGAEFGHTTASPGFAGWVRHWAAGKPWFDAA